MTYRFQLFALLLALVASPVVPAQQVPAPQASGAATYTVEVVVFRGGNTAAGEELLSTSGVLSSDDGDGGSGGATGPSRLLQVLPADRYRLGDVVSRLNASGVYRVVAHAAWQQTAAGFNSRTSLPAEQLGLATNGLSGAAYLQRGQYLHLGLNLTYAGNGGTQVLNERRRAKLGERMYFDHPAFGVIAVVTSGAGQPAP